MKYIYSLSICIPTLSILFTSILSSTHDACVFTKLFIMSIYQSIYLSIYDNYLSMQLLSNSHPTPPFLQGSFVPYCIVP